MYFPVRLNLEMQVVSENTPGSAKKEADGTWRTAGYLTKPG